MNTFYIDVKDLRKEAQKLCAGDKVYLTGTVYTARDAAHARLVELLNCGKQLPFPLNGAVIYYAGPTPAPDNMSIGSCGPTTSCRMDDFTPKLLNAGLAAMIGKGGRNAEVTEAIMRNRAVYFCAIGGAGALAAQCITTCHVIAYDDLGCESIKELTIDKFPLFVGIDTFGNSIFPKAKGTVG